MRIFHRLALIGLITSSLTAFSGLFQASMSFARENSSEFREPASCTGPAPSAWKYQFNQSFYGTKNYIEYIAGELPIILSAPHGGYLAPDEIPAQEGAIRDGGSQENARLVADELFRLTGKRPHLIINHLTRNRLNANRDKSDEPSYGNPHAEKAWDEFHQFIEDAKAWVSAACYRGHYFDFHTNGHADNWVELGMALNRTDLYLSDSELNAPELINKSTLRNLAHISDVSFAEIVRGPSSLGGFLEKEGVKVVPGPGFPDPGNGGFFNGGYNVRRHGSTQGGVIDGTQIESHFIYINNGSQARMEYSKKLARAILNFMEIHYGFQLSLSSEQ